MVPLWISLPKCGVYEYIKERFEPPYAIHTVRVTYDWASKGDKELLCADGTDPVDPQEIGCNYEQ